MSDFPEIITGFPDRPLGHNDYLVICCGFEERSIALLRQATLRGAGFTVICFCYMPSVKENDSRRDEIVTLAGGQACKIRYVTYDRYAPPDLSDFFGNILPGSRLMLDVSAMSRLLIVQLVAAAVARGPEVNFEIGYSSAAYYPPNREQVMRHLADVEREGIEAAEFVSSGVYEVVIAPELSTAAMLGEPIHLVAFPSFNTSQMLALKHEVQPSYYTVINGVSPHPENEWRCNAIFRLNKIAKIPGVESIRASTVDYRETVAALESVHLKCGRRHKIVVASTGSKMQCVAVGLFRSRHQDVQIVHPATMTFDSPSEYTTGIGQIYHFPLEARNTGHAPHSP